MIHTRKKKHVSNKNKYSKRQSKIVDLSNTIIVKGGTSIIGYEPHGRELKSYFTKSGNAGDIVIDIPLKFLITSDSIYTNKVYKIDSKLLKRIKKKKIEITKNSYTNIVKNNCMEFIKNNYGILIILIVLVLLLYYRYRDVKKKRERMNI